MNTAVQPSDRQLIENDIEQYLRTHENKSLLRFITCGSVDDGKSTLIGRLLYESKALLEDQLSALEGDSPRSDLDIFGYRREMEEYEAGYQAVLAEEHEELQRELAEQESAQHGTPKA